MVCIKLKTEDTERRENQMRTAYHAIKHHLVALPVLDLVVQVLRQIQAPVNVLLKPSGALRGETVPEKCERRPQRGPS